MGIQLYYHDLIVIGWWLVLLFIGYKFKNIKVRCFVLFLAFMALFFNPIRFEGQGGAVLERGFTDSYEEELPPVIRSEEKSFAEQQKLKYDELKQQSKEIQP